MGAYMANTTIYDIIRYLERILLKELNNILCYNQNEEQISVTAMLYV